MKTDRSICYAVALSLISSPSANRLWEYLREYKSEEIYQRITSKGKIPAQDFVAREYSEDPLEAAKRIVEKTAERSIKIIDYWSADYPLLLREIEKPPVVLYWKGALIQRETVAVVGTRRSDHRSERIACRISGDLARKGISVVSGMAIGIDRAAHMGALDVMGSTVGILANGIDVVYPKLNRDLYERIESSENSALVSEYPPGILAGKWTFVRRNRIISGMSLGTVVIKAGLKSGAMITARYAVEQNREVFACPGHSFDQDYEGCNRLIKNGAVIVTSSGDITDELPDYNRFNCLSDVLPGTEIKDKVIEIPAGNPLEEEVIRYLSGGESDVDSIIRNLGYPACRINEALVMLELSGRIFRNGNIVAKV